MRRPWQCHRTVLVSLTLTLGLGCGHDPAEPADVPDVEDTWTFFETLADAPQTLTCRDQGYLYLGQSEAHVAGSGTQIGTCEGPDGTVDNSGYGDVTSGRVHPEDVTFTFGGCDYQGTLHHTPVDSIAGSVSCPGAPDGSRPALTGTWSAGRGEDVTPPTAEGALVPPPGDTLFVPGDPLRITVTAQDDRKLNWVGYRLGPPAARQDSVHVPVSSVDTAFSVTVPSAWVGESPLVIFARDGFDRVTETPVRSLRVYDLVRANFRTAELNASATAVVYDAKRARLYLLEPELGRIAVYGLPDLSTGPSMEVPTALPQRVTEAMDLSPSGDSLLLAVTVPAAVHVISLLDGTTDSVPIVDAGAESLVLHDVHVAAGQAFAFGEREEAGYITGRLWAIDLATRALQRRDDVGPAGVLGLSAEFGTSGDRSRMMVVDLNVACVQLFSLATGFGSCASLPSGPMYLPSGSADGSAWLVRHVLYDGSLGITATPMPDGAPAGVLAPDASLAYYSTALGFDVIELPGGAVRAHVRVPYEVSRLTLLPDLGRIVTWTGAHLSTEPRRTDRITVVELP